jgi:hypothetical protein
MRTGHEVGLTNGATPEAFGEIAYNAYCSAVGGRSVHGESLPSWAEQRERRPEIAEAWIKAARAVRSADAASAVARIAAEPCD